MYSQISRLAIQSLVLITVWIISIENKVFSQTHEPRVDSSQTLQFFRNGKFHFHSRAFFMSTINQGALLDYSTLATGAGMGYQTANWKGLSLGFSGFFIFQAFENNIRIADPSTQNTNRYELALYDMNDPNNRVDLDRLEELYLRFEKKWWKLG